MTNFCTYLPSEPVLPKDSLLYSKYNILNQLNNLRIDGEKLAPEVKMKLFSDLFINVPKPQKVSNKKLQSYFRSIGFADKSSELAITGIDEIQGTMKSYIDLRNIFGQIPDTNTAEDLIKMITVLGPSGDLLHSYLKTKYDSVFTDAQIGAVCKLKYSDWGRLSKTFLTEIYHVDPATGECNSILSVMENTQNDLMQLLSNNYSFSRSIDAFKSAHSSKPDKIHYGLLNDLYVSPSVKRSIWRTLCLANEVVKVTGHAPKKIFVEVARDSDKSKKGIRTVSRKAQLTELYSKCAKEQTELFNRLIDTDEGALRDNRLFLYYTQMGRCMYSGEQIDPSEIFTKYDIDHIYPQSKVKDDSTDNKVLVKRVLNDEKSDSYPIPEKCISGSAKDLWQVLLDKNLISKEKYSRLTRKTSFSDEELAGFIARQLIETRQATKAVAQIFESIYPDTSIVYVKAGNVSDFRQRYDFIKSRLVNDYHHAKDAYLNIVVGNVYDTKFTATPINFIKTQAMYSMNRVFDFNVTRGGYAAWVKDNDASLITVKKVMAKNNILFTRYATEAAGGFFDQTLLKKGNGQFPIKTGDPRMTIEKYGGYNKISSAYYFLVDHIEKGKDTRTIEYVPVFLARKIEREPALLLEYCKNTLHLEEPRILLPKIKIDTLFCVNGFYMHLSGRTGNQLAFKCANQLVLSENLYTYAKKIESYIERNLKDRIEYPITEHQKITTEQNFALYDELLHKLKDTVYKIKLSAQIETLEQGRETFSQLALPKQCRLLYNAFGLFGTCPSGTDLTLIGGSRNAGILLISANLKNSPSVCIINQSVTGLFKQEIDLKKL